MGLLRPAAHEVLISLGRSGPGDGGIFEFSSQLALRIAAVAPQWRDLHDVGFSFHLRPDLQGLFGGDVGYLPLQPLHRYRHRTPRHYTVWHSTHQMNKSQPPAGCGPRVVTVHDLNYLYGRNAFSTWRHHRRTLGLMRRTDVVVAISHHTAADVKTKLGWTGPLSVIHNGARSFTAAPQEPLPGLEQPARPFLYHLSRMSPSKNPESLLGMARIWPEMDFVLCGPPSDDAKALKAANTLPNVHFRLGINDGQKAWAYAHCAGFLFPSLTEGFGLPPIEAMHFGKPVFLARRTCLPEIGGDAAYYFDEFDPQAMRAVVEAGLRAGAQPGRSAAVQAHAAQFDWDRTAEAYLALYARLLNLPA